MLGNYVSFDSLCFNDGIDMIFKKQQQIANYTVVFPHKQGSYAETYRVKDFNGKLRFLKLISFAKLNHSQYNVATEWRTNHAFVLHFPTLFF